MITDKLLKQYREYNGDLDAWSRSNNVESYEDWYLISNLVQSLWLIKQNSASENLIIETGRLIQENVESEKGISMLYSLIP